MVHGNLCANVFVYILKTPGSELSPYLGPTGPDPFLVQTGPIEWDFISDLASV